MHAMLGTPQKTVLIADDIEFVRKTLRTILQGGGFQVVAEATNGEEAVQLFQKFKPTFVTVDLVMPLMSGIDVTKSILRIEPSTRVVVLTAMMQEHLVTEAIQAGARDYLVKPFQAQDVIQTLTQLL